MTINWSLVDNMWTLPWVLTIVAIYVFALPWIYFAIIDNYLIHQDWESVLIGLGQTTARRVFMGGHMVFGAVTIVLGPTQFMAKLRRKLPRFHRYCGRLYVACALLTALFGLIFICLKGFILVGGINMGLAFAAAGICFGYCAFKVYWEAKNGRFREHRNWVVRSYSQILSPMLYRYFYSILVVMGWYVNDYEYDVDLCNEQTQTCPAFEQPFDMVHAWTYWLFPLGVAEIIVQALPQDPEGYAPAIRVVEENLLMTDEGPKSYGSDLDVEEVSADNVVVPVPCDETGESTKGSALAFNMVGFVLAAATVSMTATILVRGSSDSGEDL